MSEAIEFQGKNVEQALQAASDALNVPVTKLNHEVITYGSSGIFGLVGVKKAKIRVFVPRKKAAPSPPAETRVPSPAAGGGQPQPDTGSHEQAEAPGYDDSLVDYGRTALQKIISGISQDADVDVEQRRGKLFFSVTNGQSGVLIGKRGQTLEAIQYLLEKMINKKSAHRVRVLVDVEGYLEKRKANLQHMAERMAAKAKRTRKPVTIGQMNSHDRRIVHIHLKDESGVRTQSIGDGYYRKLMIFPKKQGGNRKSKKRVGEQQPE